jgi:hypothetical protein
MRYIVPVIRSCAGGSNEARRGLCYDTHHVWATIGAVTLSDTHNRLVFATCLDELSGPAPAGPAEECCPDGRARYGCTARAGGGDAAPHRPGGLAGSASTRAGLCTGTGGGGQYPRADLRESAQVGARAAQCHLWARGASQPRRALTAVRDRRGYGTHRDGDRGGAGADGVALGARGAGRAGPRPGAARALAVVRAPRGCWATDRGSCPEAPAPGAHCRVARADRCADSTTRQ